MLVRLTIFLFFSVVIYETTGQSNDRPGQDARMMKRMCFETCRDHRLCPSSNTINSNDTNISSECLQCLDDECDEIDSSNTLELQHCKEEALGDCDACATSISRDRMSRRRYCMSCVRACSRQRRGNMPRPRRPAGQPIPRRSIFRRLQCMRGCRSNDQCQTRQDFLNQLSRPCRAAILQTCGPFNPTSMFDCVENTLETSAQCLQLTPEQQSRKRNCETCVQGCSTRGRQQPLRRIRNVRRRFICMQNCQSTCPSRDWISSLYNGTRSQCRSCIIGECGDLTRNSGSESFDCIVEAREACAICPPMTTERRRMLRQCRSCIRRCTSTRYIRRTSYQRSGPRPGPRQGLHGGSRFGTMSSRRFRPFQTFGCLMNCQSSSSCPAPQEMLRRMRNINDDCKECIMEKCGCMRRSGRSAMMSCFMRARPMCSECPEISEAEMTRMRSCRTCVQGCMPDRGFIFPRGGRRGSPFRRPVRPFLLMGCASTCQNSSSCPSREDMMSRFQATPSACKSCLNRLCGNAGNHQDRLECIEENRDNCSACPALTQAEQIQRRECKQCLMNCTAEQRENMPRPGIRLIQTASCLRNCQSPQSCPTKEEIRNRIMSLPDDCKQCVNETCGWFNQTRCPGHFQCVHEAIKDCAACPTLSAADQIRRRTCKLCVRNCLPHGGRRWRRCRRPIPKPFEKLMCLRRCFVRDRCPDRDEILAKFQNTSAQCQVCVNMSCNNSNSPIDCITSNLPQCSDCPDPDRSDRRRMMSCRRCVRSCLFDAECRRKGRPGRRMDPRRPGRPGLSSLLGGGRCQNSRRPNCRSRPEIRNPNEMNSPGMGPGRRRIPGGNRPFGIRPTGPFRNGPGQCSIGPRDVMALFMQGQGNPQLRLQRCMCVRQCMGNGPQNSQGVGGDDENDCDDEDEQRRGYNSRDSNEDDNDDNEDEFCDDDE